MLCNSSTPATALTIPLPPCPAQLTNAQLDTLQTFYGELFVGASGGSVVGALLREGRWPPGAAACACQAAPARGRRCRLWLRTASLPGSRAPLYGAVSDRRSAFLAFIK